MQTPKSSNPKFTVPGGATPIPNWVFDRNDLNGVEREVLWSLHRSAYRESLVAKIGVAYIAKRFERGRGSVRSALKSLRERGFIVKMGDRDAGDAQEYELVLIPPRVVCTDHPPGPLRPSPWSPGATIKKQSLKDKNALPAVTSAIDSGVELDANGSESRGSAECSASSAAVQSIAEVPLALLAELRSEVMAELKPALKPTKALVNAEMLTPRGLRASSDYDNLRHDLCDLILYDVRGEKFNPDLTRPGQDELDKLVDEHGVRYVAHWASWLPRKIAALYESAKPVKSPTALLIKAVTERWQVDPAWPEFDESKHTWRAAAHLAEQKKARQCVVGQSKLQG